MSEKISIIIPCYNCQDTLEQAVLSVYRQNIDASFEIIMVDDASTDQTWTVMCNLARRYKEVKLFRSEVNKGGGATRNLAVLHSEGKIIFCLDSDDMLPPDTLPTMIKFLVAEKVDGALFSQTIFFFKDPKKPTNIVKHRSKNNFVNFADLFSPSSGFLTQVNFLFTKNAWAKVGGYPEHHGFDSQGFGFRFLSHGLMAKVCPETSYLHRQGLKKKSYFERVYASGEFSKNFYLIIEECISKFSRKTRLAIMSYAIFSNNKLGQNNLKSFLDELYAMQPKNFFCSEIDQQPPLSPQDHLADLFSEACQEFTDAHYFKVWEIYGKMLQYDYPGQVMTLNLIRIGLALSNSLNRSDIEKKAIMILGQGQFVHRYISTRPNRFITWIVRREKLKKIFQKILEKIVL